MKRIIAFVLVFLMILSLLLVSCNNEDVSDNLVDQTSEEIVADTEPVDNSPYTAEESFMPEEIYTQLKSLYTENKKGFSTIPNANMPYISSAITEITDCTLKSISIPVFRTGKADENGDLHFTLYVFDSSFAGIKKEPKRTYDIKINAEKNGITPLKSQVFKYVEVDLSSYEIVLSKDETVGFCNKDDTIISAYITNNSDNTNETLKMLRSDFPRVNGCYMKAGSDLMEYSADTLLFDLKWERTYENRSAYNAEISKEAEYSKMVEALKEKYKGKYISLIGDSISTFEGICNDTSANKTIGNNAVYYSGKNHNIFDFSQTYWGRLIKDLEMNIGVINTWSGSLAYGATEGKGNMLDRAVQLHRDGGTASASDDIAPDVVIIYIGINDLNGGITMGDLYIKLRKDNGVSDKEKVAEWFEKVSAQAKKTNGVVQGKTYNSYEQVYALSIQAIKEKYPNAEIYCMTLQESNHSNTTKAKLESYNRSIKAIAEYFDLPVIDQGADEITWENCHSYGCDIRALHPNVPGHKKMTENIVKTMYENLK